MIPFFVSFVVVVYLFSLTLRSLCRTHPSVLGDAIRGIKSKTPQGVDDTYIINRDASDQSDSIHAGALLRAALLEDPVRLSVWRFACCAWAAGWLAKDSQKERGACFRGGWHKKTS